MKRQITKCEIHILADGNVQIGRVMGEAGFAALVKVQYDDMSDFEFLFDTAGGTPALAHNIGIMKEKLGRDLSSIEMIVLSHGHWDHAAGVLKVFEMIGKPVPVLCHPDALLHKICTEESGKKHEIGIHNYYSESNLAIKTTVIETEKPYKIADGITTTGVVPRANDYERLTGNLEKIVTIRADDEIPDSIDDDLSVMIHLKDDSVLLLTGCCHSGIVNTINHSVALTGSSSIAGIVGGLHLHDASKNRLTKTIDHLKQYPLATIGACHCTGLKGRAALMYAFEDSFKDIGAGSVLKFESTVTE